MHELPNDENMENINETPSPEDNSDSLDAENAEPAETVEHGVDPDELLAEAAKLSDPLVDDDIPEADAYSEPAAEPSFSGATYSSGPTNNPAPPQNPAYAETRLTRDPFATLGGVLSGIAHRYGWDVALTRIGFVVVFLMSGGTALLAYALAWIVIPRAQFWPPAQRHTVKVSGRDLGIGLLALAGIIVLGASSGEFAGVLVPLALIGGGVWLLNQNPRKEEAPVAAFAGTTAGGTPIDGTPPQYSQDTHNQASFNQAPLLPPFEPQPAPKRSRVGRAAVVAAILGVMAIPVVAIGGLIMFAAVANIDSGDLDFESSEEFGYVYTDVDEIPSVISEEAGDVTIDLTNVDFSSVSADDPVELDVDLDFGSLQVILPEDVRVDIDAEADFVGEVQLFDNENSGFSPDAGFSDDDAQLRLTLDVNVGEVSVSRG